MQQLSIGAFSRLTHLSVKTLRYYHEVGLLEPAVVDPDSGYRYYRPGQAHSAHLVRRFRDLGLPVADVKAVLATPDPAARNTILAGHLDRMREQLRQTEAAVDSLYRMLEGGAAATTIEERTLLVQASPSLDGPAARWEPPAGPFAVALHVGAHRDVDRTYAALGTYAAAHELDGTGPVRERYLTDPLSTRDSAQWRTEVCWPLASAGAQAN